MSIQGYQEFVNRYITELEKFGSAAELLADVSSALEYRGAVRMAFRMCMIEREQYVANIQRANKMLAKAREAK